VIEIALTFEGGAQSLGGKAVRDHAHPALEELVLDLHLLEGDGALAPHGLGDLGDLVDQFGGRNVLVEHRAFHAEHEGGNEASHGVADEDGHSRAAQHDDGWQHVDEAHRAGSFQQDGGDEDGEAAHEAYDGSDIHFLGAPGVKKLKQNARLGSCWVGDNMRLSTRVNEA
jgi:hypothetical protein